MDEPREFAEEYALRKQGRWGLVALASVVS